ncbi:MAG: hypothetical protein HC906_10655 [Bacteroidales bacterium]|nr:hypothetical protein [Bacteroidales bacterium]
MHFFAIGCKNKIDKVIPTAKVTHGELNLEVVETGELRATNAINIFSPALSWRFGQLKITRIIEDGDEITAGDTVITFDPSEVEKARIDADANLEIARAELDKMKAEHESKIHELEANYKTAQIDFEISEIELEQSAYEADVTKKEIQLNLEKAKISFEKARSEIENQKKINKETEVQQLLKIKQYEIELKDAEETLRSLTVISPESGLAIIRENWASGNKWQSGDATWSGNPMIDLPDLSELKVYLEISELIFQK